MVTLLSEQTNSNSGACMSLDPLPFEIIKSEKEEEGGGAQTTMTTLPQPIIQQICSWPYKSYKVIVPTASMMD